MKYIAVICATDLILFLAASYWPLRVFAEKHKKYIEDLIVAVYSYNEENPDLWRISLTYIWPDFDETFSYMEEHRYNLFSWRDKFEKQHYTKISEENVLRKISLEEMVPEGAFHEGGMFDKWFEYTRPNSSVEFIVSSWHAYVDSGRLESTPLVVNQNCKLLYVYDGSHDTAGEVFKWKSWEVDLSKYKGKPIKIIAQDNSPADKEDTGEWVAISQPILLKK